MKTILNIIFVLSMPLVANSFTLNTHYKNGEEVCHENQKVMESEFHAFVDVPLDYQNNFSEKTKIYTYLKKEYNPSLPSVLFFTGGPGVSSRATEFSLDQFNVIFFEQRGISCSRPKEERTFLDPAFYSSENTARDALAILDYYQIKKAAIYGHSYGTIPATIFASFFPERSLSLTLEGVVFKADEKLWRSPKKLIQLQSFFDHLEENKKNKILSLSEQKNIPQDWFSKIGNMMMYLHDGLNAYNSFLDYVLNLEIEISGPFINSFYSNPELPEEEFNFGSVAMGMIACQEMSMAKENLSMTSVFQDEVLVSTLINVDKHEFCSPLNLTQHQEAQTFNATKYPVSVFTTYLLGEDDGATAYEQGLNHYQRVAKGSKQILTLKKGGHLPILALLKDVRPCRSEKDCFNLKQNYSAQEVFQKVLNAVTLSSQDVQNLNRAGELYYYLQ